MVQYQDDRKEQETDCSKETALVVRSVQATKLPTLTFGDTKRFQDLLHDVFPDVDISNISNVQLEEAIKNVLIDRKMEIIPAQV